MKWYRQFCLFIGLSPRLYLLSLVIGFWGVFCCLLAQKVEGYWEYASVCLPFAGAPHLLVLYSAKGTYWHRSSKIWVGCLASFLAASLPGGLAAQFAANQFLPQPSGASERANFRNTAAPLPGS
jgi:hypothetical protein